MSDRASEDVAESVDLALLGARGASPRLGPLRFGMVGERPGTSPREFREGWLRELVHALRAGGREHDEDMADAVGACYARRYAGTGLAVASREPDERERRTFGIDESHRVLIVNGEATGWSYRLADERYVAFTSQSDESHFDSEDVARQASTMFFDAATRRFELLAGDDMLGDMADADLGIVMTRRFITSVDIDDCWFAVAAWEEPHGRRPGTHVVEQRTLPAGTEVVARFGRTYAAIGSVCHHVSTLGARDHLALPVGSAVQLPFTREAEGRFDRLLRPELELVPFGSDIVRRRSARGIERSAHEAREL